METWERARQIIYRYRYETPLGNQPYMSAHEAEEVINLIDQTIKQYNDQWTPERIAGIARLKKAHQDQQSID
jgi:hypothetical protein